MCILSYRFPVHSYITLFGKKYRSCTTTKSWWILSLKTSRVARQNFNKEWFFYIPGGVTKKPSLKNKNYIQTSWSEYPASIENESFQNYNQNFGYDYQKFVYDDKAHFFN